MPDKWEFSNDNFKREQKELLTEIRRRKSAATSPSPIPIPDAAGQRFPANSGEDLGSGSTSTSSYRDSRNPGSVDTSNVAKLGEENKKLKIDNQKLNSELGQTKKQCQELIGFLTKYVKVGPDHINHMVSQGSFESSPDADGLVGEKGREIVNNECDDDESGECLKLFGVWMKEKKNKRGREENGDDGFWWGHMVKK